MVTAAISRENRISVQTGPRRLTRLKIYATGRDNGYSIKLFAVPDNFPIPQKGILGFEFLQYAIKIDLREKYTLWQEIKILFISETIIAPARLRSTFYVKIANPQVPVGYISRLEAGKGLYLGDAMVTNRDGIAYLQITNTMDKNKWLEISIVKLEEVDMCEALNTHRSEVLPDPTTLRAEGTLFRTSNDSLKQGIRYPRT